MARILLAEDDEIMRVTLQDHLGAGGLSVDVAEDGKEALVLIKKRFYALVISDIRMPGLDGLTLLQHVKRLSPETEVILMTAFGGVDDAVSCLKKGAAEYILKPFDMDDLSIRVQRILDRQAVMASTAKCVREDEKPLVGSSLAMQQVIELIGTVAQTDSTVLITGESGTGKELVAAAIHHQSKRFNRPYIRINCAAIPDNLIESELFGHEKGAFTGAEKNKIGKFELADGGTLLLDEIGDMPLHLQVKLLRVLQEREIERVGGTAPLSVDVRILCSTARNLQKCVEEGSFRKDLYYRLKVIPIEIPPLRHRKEDIAELCSYFLQEFSATRGMALTLSKETLDILSQYDYPGNVRELRNILERISVLTTQPELNPKLLPFELWHSADNGDGGDFNLANGIAQTEKKYILRALQKSGNNKTEAAKLLGISRKNLWEKMKLHQLAGD